MSCNTSCFSGIIECMQGPSFNATQSYKDMMDALQIRLNPVKIGQNVVLHKERSRITGDGGALANAPMLPDKKAYFDVKVHHQDGVWGVGLALQSAHLDASPVVKDVWVLTNDAKIMANGNAVALDDPHVVVEHGDVIGVTFDEGELVFYRNGHVIGHIGGLEGTLYPVVYVANDAQLDVHFEHFAHKPPHGYGAIVMEETKPMS